MFGERKEGFLCLVNGKKGFLFGDRKDGFLFGDRKDGFFVW